VSVKFLRRVVDLAWERGRPRPHAAKMAALQWPCSTARKKMTDTRSRTHPCLALFAVVQCRWRFWI